VRYDAPDWDAAVLALKDASDVTIACHVNPDGDALGSLLGASVALRKIGKTTYPTWGTSPLAAPVQYDFLPGIDTLVQPADAPVASLFLALDCGAADRLGELETTMTKSPLVVNVDHHPGNDDFGHLNVVVTGASSTAELVARLVEDAGIEIDREIATCLYTGIVTDTGRFQYSNSSPDTLRLAADLLSYGVPAAAIALDVFESAPFGYLKLLGRVLERAQLLEKERFVYSWVTRADLEETGVSIEETDQLIELIRATRAAEVAAMFKEQADGRFRVSLRSKGPRSVGAIARAHGGGGHELAAGFTTDSVDAAVAEIKRELSA
jgi:bifunctional oligoribonuclease and PAP phosphatase NrnA